MKKGSFGSCVVASAMLCMVPLCAQVPEGWVPISGHVYRSDGKPLAGAEVSLFPLQAASSGPMPGAKSAPDGSFHLSSPEFGKTRICASLAQLGYPDTRGKLFSSPDDHFPEVNIVAGSDLRDIEIHLGPPDGIVEGAVVDAETGKPVAFARILLRWHEDPSVFYSSGISMDGHFQYALPDRPITITITAPGHRTYTYTDPVTHSPYIEASSLDHTSLTISMVRSVPPVTGRR